MDDLISRAKAIEQMNLYGSVWIEYTDDMTKEQVIAKALMESKWTLIEVVKQLPSAQPKRGKWIYCEDSIADCVDGYRCDQCGFFVPWDYQHKGIDYIQDYNFCPNCGADMRGEKDG